MPSIPGFKKVDRGYDEFLASVTGWWTKVVFESPTTKPWTYTFVEATGCVVGVNPNTVSKPDGTPCGDYLGGATWCFDDAGKLVSSVFVSPPEWDKCYQPEARLAATKGVETSFFSPPGPDNFFNPDKYKSLVSAKQHDNKKNCQGTHALPAHCVLRGTCPKRVAPAAREPCCARAAGVCLNANSYLVLLCAPHTDNASFLSAAAAPSLTATHRLPTTPLTPGPTRCLPSLASRKMPGGTTGSWPWSRAGCRRLSLNHRPQSR